MSDNWIKFEYEMPKLTQEVELIYKDGEIIKAKLLMSSCDGASCFLFDSEDKKDYIKPFYLKGWRPLPEKRPDFGKLREGNLIAISYYERNQIYVGFFNNYFDDDYIEISSHKNGSGITFCKKKINKITKINLEEQKFEEI